MPHITSSVKKLNQTEPAQLKPNTMKNKLRFTRSLALVAIVILLIMPGRGWGQSLLVDDFTGLTTGNLAGQSSWTKGGSGPEATVANTTAMTYTNYNGGGGEYVVMPTSTATASRVYKGFTSTTANGNTFYFSFLLRLTSTTATGDYFITLGDPTTGTNYAPRLFAKTSGAGYVLGASKAANVASATFGATVLSLNTTYLVVVRFTSIAGATNDLTYVWVNPSLASEPSTGTAEVTVPTGDADPGYTGGNIGNFHWHNRTANNPAGAFDGVRVAYGSTSAIAWTSLNAYSAPSSTNYYLKSGGSIATLADWGTNTAGTSGGPAPALNSDNIVWNIYNSSPTLGTDWTLGAGSKIVVDGTNSCNFTIPALYKVAGTVDVSAAATLSIANTTNYPTLGTLAATSTVAYTGGSAQSVAAATYGNLSISTTGGNATAGGAIGVTTTLTVASGSILDMGSANLLTGAFTTSGTGTLKTAVPTATSATPIPTAKTWTMNLVYNSTSAQTVVTGTYGNIQISNTGAAKTPGGDITLGNSSTFTIDAGVTYTAGTTKITFGTSGTAAINGIFQTAITTASSFSGAATSSIVSTNAPTITLGTGSTIEYNSVSTQTISTANSSGTTGTLTYYNLLISGITGAKTFSASPAIAAGGTFTVNPSCIADLASTQMSFGVGCSVVINGTLNTQKAIGGLSGSASSVFISTNSPTVTLGSASTINYNGTGAQAISAIQYANLTIGGTRSGTPAITLSPGTIGISGVATNSISGAVTWVNTSNTVDYNGTGSQTVAAINYNNLTISGVRSAATITLPTGTIDIAGTFSYTASGSPTITPNASSIFNFSSASSQTIPAFTYNSITNTGNGLRTLENGTIKLAGTFTPGSGNYTIGTSTVEFDGTTAQSIPVIPVASGANYYNLTYSGSNIGTANGSLNIAGTLIVSGGTVILNNTASQRIFNIVNVTMSAGILNTGSLDVTGNVTSVLNITGNFYKTGGTTDNTSPAGIGSIVFNGGVTQTFNLNIATTNAYHYIDTYVQNNSTLTLNTGLKSTGVTGIFLTIDPGSTIIAGTNLISTTSATTTIVINGTLKTSNLNGLSGSTSTTIVSTNTPTLTLGANSTIEYNAASGTQVVTPRSDYKTLSITGGGTKTLASAATVATALNLTASTFTNSTFLTLSDGATVNRYEGTLSANPTYGATTGVDVYYLGANDVASGASSTPLLTPASGKVRHLNINLSDNTKTINTSTGAAATISGNVTITSGTLSLGNNISVAGDWSRNSTGTGFTPGSGTATFNGGSAQAITVTGGGTASFAGLTLNNSAGLSLSASTNLALTGTLTLSTGAISLNGNTLSYGTNGILTFNGIGYSATTDAEFPATNGPKDLNINNADPVGISLHANRILAGTLTIASSKSLILPVNRQLTVNGATTLNGTECLVLKSDANGTASFIDNGTISGAGTAKVERYLAKYTALDDKMFHFISSPVAVQAIRTEFVTNTPTPNQDFYSFSESTNEWINSRADGNIWNTLFEDNFAAGKGYMVAYSADVTKNFTGTLNAGTQVLNCTYTTTGSKGWNLVGNPFASAIDWDYIKNNAGLGNGMDDALYYYDNTAKNYRYYIQLSGETGALGSGQQYIPAMQGFMVHAKATGTKTVTISNLARTHSGQSVFYKSSNSVPGSLSLKVSANGYEDEAFIHFNHAATTAFDGEYDAFKLKSYSANVPSIYTVASDGNQLAINGLPEVEENSEIPVYFEAGTNGQYTLTANLQNLLEAHVYLVDHKLSKTQNLSDNPVYTFAASTTDQPSRFKLTFKSVGINETASSQPFTIYASNNTVYVDNTSTTSVKGEVYVYNTLGQVMAHQNLNGDRTKINIAAATGYYLVKVITEKNAFTDKIFVKQQ